MRIKYLYFLIIAILLFSCGKISHEKFDSNKWKEEINTEENWTLRWKMMNDLRNNYKLEAKTKNEIIDLLGNPDVKFQNVFQYSLGYTGKGINTGTLYIYFDSQNKVENISVSEG
ncbi:hypothetical protein OBK22_13445 [Empedobacter falsenii]